MYGYNMTVAVQQPMIQMRCRHSTLMAVQYNERFGFNCNGCGEMGYGCCYQCTNGCNYRLHQECLMASPVAHHPFYIRGPFFLQSQNSPNTSFVCNACGMTAKGLRYVRDTPRGSFFLHPCCMNMPGCIQTDDGETLYLNKKLVSFPCQYCERMTPVGGPIGGWAYVSADQQLACHVKCMKQMLYQNWRTNAQRPQLQAQWWLAPYGGSTGSSSTTTMGYRNAGRQPQNNGSSGRKRRIFWKIAKISAKLLFSFSTGDPTSLLTAFHDMLQF